MKKSVRKESAITLEALIVTIIILLLLAGITIATLGGKNGLFSKVKQGKEKYAISEAKEKLELEIANLQIEQQGKGEELKKEDLPKMNSKEIDVRDTTNFPVEVICQNYKFKIDNNFQATYVEEANETIITYTTEPDKYTNQNNVKVLVKISNPKGIKSILKPGETDKILPQDRTTAGVDFTVTKNGHYILKVEDVDGNEVSKDIYIDLIDKLAPLTFIPTTKDVEKLNISIKADVQDAEADEINSKSGIEKYEYYIKDSDNSDYTKYESTNAEFEFTDLKPKHTYYIYVKAFDRAGNFTDSKEITIQTIDTYLIQSGKTLVDWTEYYQNHTSGNLNKKNRYILFNTGGSGVFSNYHTKIDLTNISKIYFYGKINNINVVSGHFYVSEYDKTDSTETIYGGKNEGLKKSIQITTKLDKYEIDVSELIGEYYIGFFGSCRTISIYDVYYE